MVYFRQKEDNLKMRPELWENVKYKDKTNELLAS